MKPLVAIKQTLVEQGFSQPIKEYKEKLLDIGTKVRYLYEPGINTKVKEGNIH